MIEYKKEELRKKLKNMARMISRQEAAELLDCNVQTVTNWVGRGLLKGHSVGRALMVDSDSIIIKVNI